MSITSRVRNNVGLKQTKISQYFSSVGEPVQKKITSYFKPIVSYNGNEWTLADKDYKALTGVNDIRYRKAISGRYILCNNQPVRYNKKGDYWKANSIYIKGDKLMIQNAKNKVIEINPTDFSLGEGRQ